MPAMMVISMCSELCVIDNSRITHLKSMIAELKFKRIDGNLCLAVEHAV